MSLFHTRAPSTVTINHSQCYVYPAAEALVALTRSWRLIHNKWMPNSTTLCKAQNEKLKNAPHAAASWLEPTPIVLNEWTLLLRMCTKYLIIRVCAQGSKWTGWIYAFSQFISRRRISESTKTLVAIPTWQDAIKCWTPGVFSVVIPRWKYRSIARYSAVSKNEVVSPPILPSLTFQSFVVRRLV